MKAAGRPPAARIACVVTLLTGCGHDATAPINLAPSYDLVMYEGQSLPVTTRRIVAVQLNSGDPSYSCDDRLVSERLEFGAGSRFTQTDSRLLVCDDGRPDQSSSEMRTGSYAISRDGLELDFDPVEIGGGSITLKSYAHVTNADLTIYFRSVVSEGFGATFTYSPLVFHARQ